METRLQTLIQPRFVCFDPIDDALVEICGCEFPRFASETNIVAVMNLGKMVEGARLTRERKNVSSTLVLNLNKALFDINIGSSILAHGSQLHQPARRDDLPNRPEKIKSAADVIDLGEYGAIMVNHRVWGRGLFAVMDNGVWPKSLQHAFDKAVVAQVGHEKFHFPASDLAPGRHTIVQGADGNQWFDVQFHLPAAFGEIVQDADSVSPAGQIHGRRPAQISVTT